ncbi:MAG TPA: hypothetical protein VGF94_18325 [Kofleriaceae bacterium]
MVAACAFVTCRHAAPAPVIVPLRATPAMASPPPMWPAVGQVRATDAGALDQMQQLAPGDFVPAAVSPTKPPLDGGLDGGVPLPPIPLPDGGLLRDAGLPMGESR